MDIATGTSDQAKEIEIKFNTNSISYADRLLLKKHRRTDVDSLFTPRETPREGMSSARGSSMGGYSARGTPRGNYTSEASERGYSARGPQREKSNMSVSSIRIEEFDDGDFGEFNVKSIDVLRILWLIFVTF